MQGSSPAMSSGFYPNAPKKRVGLNRWRVFACTLCKKNAVRTDYENKLTDGDFEDSICDECWASIESVGNNCRSTARAFYDLGKELENAPKWRQEEKERLFHEGR